MHWNNTLKYTEILRHECSMIKCMSNLHSSPVLQGEWMALQSAFEWPMMGWGCRECSRSCSAALLHSHCQREMPPAHCSRNQSKEICTAPTDCISSFLCRVWDVWTKADGNHTALTSLTHCAEIFLFCSHSLQLLPFVQFSVINLTKHKTYFFYWRNVLLFHWIWGMKKIIKWKKEQGKKLRNISNFAVIAFSMDDYDSYHFWFTECWSAQFIKKTEIFPNHWTISE